MSICLQIAKDANMKMSPALCILCGQDQYRASTTWINGYFMASITKFEKNTIFKTALVSIIFILELSVLDKSCLELKISQKHIFHNFPEFYLTIKHKQTVAEL